MTRWLRSTMFLLLALTVSCQDGTPPIANPEPDSTPSTLLYAGPAEQDGEASLAYLMPGVYADVFPVDLQDKRPSNPLGVPPDIARRLRELTPEIRMWSPPPGISLVIERRGWQQGDVVTQGSCHNYFDYRVDVKEVHAGANSSKFGATATPVRWVTVFPPPAGQTGMYVLIVTEVGINIDRVGENFIETNQTVVTARQNAGLGINTTITRNTQTHRSRMKRVLPPGGLCPNRVLLRHYAAGSIAGHNSTMRC
ncbi:MAG: hypothetical protein O2910_05680 [Proteobacteria bacterium]|nr:hypothetical protein [Pseudomonadota bacterium]